MGIIIQIPIYVLSWQFCTKKALVKPFMDAIVDYFLHPPLLCKTNFFSIMNPRYIICLYVYENYIAT